MAEAHKAWGPGRNPEGDVARSQRAGELIQAKGEFQGEVQRESWPPPKKPQEIQV